MSPSNVPMFQKLVEKSPLPQYVPSGLLTSHQVTNVVAFTIAIKAEGADTEILDSGFDIGGIDTIVICLIVQRTI